MSGQDTSHRFSVLRSGGSRGREIARTELISQFKSKNRSVLSGASFYDVVDKRTIAVRRFCSFDAAQRLFVYRAPSIEGHSVEQEGEEL